jgi:hypothetical protein
MMTDMMKSPLFTQLLSDSIRVEGSRQMIVNNPMLRESMPGMGELLNDPSAWRESMQAAASLYQKMDPDNLMNAMMQGASASATGMMGGPGGHGMGLPPVPPRTVRRCGG